MGIPKPKNLYCPGNKANTKEFRDHWEETFGNKKKDTKEEEEQEDEEASTLLIQPIPVAKWYSVRSADKEAKLHFMLQDMVDEGKDVND